MNERRPLGVRKLRRWETFSRKKKKKKEMRKETLRVQETRKRSPAQKSERGNYKPEQDANQKGLVKNPKDL